MPFPNYRIPCNRPDDAVDDEAARGLERAYGAVGEGAEYAVLGKSEVSDSV